MMTSRVISRRQIRAWSTSSWTVDGKARPKTSTTIDPSEVEKFSNVNWSSVDDAAAKALEDMHPTRMGILRDYLKQRLGADGKDALLKGKTAVDIGCGGGLLTESLLELGATSVVSADPVRENLDATKARLEIKGKMVDNVEFFHGGVEDLVASNRCFDLVSALEVIEHVKDQQLFLHMCCKLVHGNKEEAPGILALSTINRTIKSYALAIAAAEYLARKVPIGTHDWKRFIKPSEMESIIHANGLHTDDIVGMVYNPITRTWFASRIDTDVNYILLAST